MAKQEIAIITVPDSVIHSSNSQLQTPGNRRETTPITLSDEPPICCGVPGKLNSLRILPVPAANPCE
jgi:hypothetical protein